MAKAKEYDLVFPTAGDYIDRLGWRNAELQPNGRLRCGFGYKGLYYIITARPNGKVINVRVENVPNGALVTKAILDIRCQPLRLTVEPCVDRVTLDELVRNLTSGGMVAKRTKTVTAISAHPME